MATLRSVEGDADPALACAAALERRLVSGGDDRIALLPETGRNAYGTPPSPSPGDIWLSSSTATGIGDDGWRAVQDLDTGLGRMGTWPCGAAAALCDSVRSRLLARFGIAGSEAILSASGTDAELLMLALAAPASDAPVTNIVMAPKESGSGVLHACAGRHFRAVTCLGSVVEQGTPLNGWQDADIETAAVDIRTPTGTARPVHEIDTEISSRVRAALEAGRSVVLHVLDTSKTGLQTCTRATAERLMRGAPERVTVVVDACQLRCGPDRVRADLERGFAVMVTGSKFAGGPPFSGALLLPPRMVEAALAGPAMPDGLSAYSAAHDWSARLRETLPAKFAGVNAGAPLRWVAALAGLDALAAIGSETVAAIVEHFDAEVCARIAATPVATPLFEPEDATPRTRSIVPLIVLDRNGAPLSPTKTAELHRALRTPIAGDETLGRIVNLGQPVPVGTRSALRICIDAPRIAAIAAALEEGASLPVALAATNADLDRTFAKLTALIDGKA